MASVAAAVRRPHGVRAARILHDLVRLTHGPRAACWFHPLVAARHCRQFQLLVAYVHVEVAVERDLGRLLRVLALNGVTLTWPRRHIHESQIVGQQDA